MSVHGLLSLVFVTVLAGAFVAGLDAGLVYPTFPKMGDYWIPPEYSALSPWYRNMFENPVATQFNHRVLGLTTAGSVLAFSLASLTAKFGRRAAMARNLLAAMVVVQASLGIATLLYHVPIPMAAAHQSGSLGSTFVCSLVSVQSQENSKNLIHHEARRFRALRDTVLCLTNVL